MNDQSWNMKSCFNCNWRKCRNHFSIQIMVHNLVYNKWRNSNWCIDELCFCQNWRWMLTHRYSYKPHFLPNSRQCILQTTCSPSSSPTPQFPQLHRTSNGTPSSQTHLCLLDKATSSFYCPTESSPVFPI